MGDRIRFINCIWSIIDRGYINSKSMGIATKQTIADGKVKAGIAITISVSSRSEYKRADICGCYDLIQGNRTGVMLKSSGSRQAGDGDRLKAVTGILITEGKVCSAEGMTAVFVDDYGLIQRCGNIVNAGDRDGFISGY